MVEAVNPDLDLDIDTGAGKPVGDCPALHGETLCTFLHSHFQSTVQPAYIDIAVTADICQLSGMSIYQIN